MRVEVREGGIWVGGWMDSDIVVFVTCLHLHLVYCILEVMGWIVGWI